MGLLCKQKRVSDVGEMEIVLGNIFVMCKTTLKTIKKSFRKSLMKSVTARNRLQLLLSKLYFNQPDNLLNEPKTFKMNENLSCLKYTNAI